MKTALVLTAIIACYALGERIARLFRRAPPPISPEQLEREYEQRVRDEFRELRRRELSRPGTNVVSLVGSRPWQERLRAKRDAIFRCRAGGDNQ